MILQLEITTRCNFDCSYCAGRHMPQLDMSFADFQKHISEANEIDAVMLHGEGESTLHADFEKMLNYLHAKSIPVRLTTNGTYPYPERLIKLDKLIVSIDSLDQEQSQSIGRSNTKKAQDFVLAATKLKINLEIVSVTGTLEPIEFHQVALWAKSIGVPHRLQQLMNKPDYVKFYPSKFNSFPLHRHIDKPAVKTASALSCPYLANKPMMKYITVQNKALPCCFIKDPTTFTSKDELAVSLATGIIPSTCTGCQNIKVDKL